MLGSIVIWYQYFIEPQRMKPIRNSSRTALRNKSLSNTWLPYVRNCTPDTDVFMKLTVASKGLSLFFYTHPIVVSQYSCLYHNTTENIYGGDSLHKHFPLKYHQKGTWYKIQGIDHTNSSNWNSNGTKRLSFVILFCALHNIPLTLYAVIGVEQHSVNSSR